MENIYPYKILFIEDEESIRKNYIVYLKMLFKEVYEAEDGLKGYSLYERKKPEIIIIDINIPKLNGIELIKKIREKDHNVKVIILTAHTDKSFLIEATSLKLTKYLVKPVSRKSLKEALELVVEELLKYKIVSLQKIELSQGYSWDLGSKELIQYDNVIDLTAKEKNFLDLLISHKNRVFTYDQIFEYVWGYEESVSINSIKNIVKRLRKKLPDNTIQNIFNDGYKLNF